MRDFVNRFGAYIVVAALLAAGMLYYLTRHDTKPASASETKAFYIDEETGEESVRLVTDVPPLNGTGGKPTIVQAMKYSCDGGKTTKVGYLMKYTAEGKEALDRMNSSKGHDQPNINIMMNILVRSPEQGSPWYSRDSGEGTRVMESFPCTEGKPQIMTPPIK